MNNQLSNLSTQYRKFSKGQYIEHTQFNEFLDFFEDQDRLSRVMLQGVGIVCGFKPEPVIPNGILNSIQLSQGVAITTDGDLLTLNNTSKASNDLYVSDLKNINIKNKQYTHFKVYDNYKVHYPAFYDDGNQIELWELATEAESKDKPDFKPVTKLNNPEDKYLLLYLESYEKEIKPCRGVDCDNHGLMQIRNLKVLVTTRAGIDQILIKDKVYPHPIFSGVMANKKLNRVILKAEKTSGSSLSETYKDVVINDSNYHTMFTNIDVISKLLDIPLINRQNFINVLRSVLDQNKGFQYGYDVIKDLMDTYTELIEILPKSFTKCLPDLLSFPKHSMLGKLISDSKLDKTRHQFYNSPILDSEKITEKVKLLVERFNQQVLHFKLPLYTEKETGIKIIPSQKLSPLSNKAIPFYYDVTEDFIKTWNFDKTSNRTSNTNLGFDTRLLSLDQHIQNPLGYNIDKKSFYRVEGHQGMSYQTVVKNIKDIKEKFQLAFDVMALSLEELSSNKDLSKAYFTKYVEEHPGLEHIGGVQRGGTFAVVYESDRNPTVVADFSLPYLCCTPKVEVKLSLPSSTICAGAKPVLFTVSPIHGVVEAEVVEGLNGGVFSNSNGQYFFNPAQVSPELQGQDIAFTVNGKATNCVIKIVSEPSIQVILNDIQHPEGDALATIVTFAVSGDHFADYDYKWDFLGNGTYVSLNPNADGNVIFTYQNLDVKRIPTIRVRISGNGCSQEITLNNWYSSSFVINSIVFLRGCCDGIVYSNCISPTLNSIIQNSDNTVSYTWNNNGFNYGLGTTILQYSIDNGINWVLVGQENPADLSGTSSVINLPNLTPIKYRVECLGNGCSNMVSNIIKDVFRNPIEVSTSEYRGLWSSGDTLHRPEINSWVDYIDEFGVTRRFIIGASQNGCQSITAQKIIDTNGVFLCDYI
jgi:hypothetical protein